MAPEARDEVVLDGSRGEGGGQILRTALALSAATGRPFTIRKIRANRPKPGLAAQHLMSVRAAAAVCEAETEGDRVRSQELVFRPTSFAEAPGLRSRSCFGGVGTEVDRSPGARPSQPRLLRRSRQGRPKELRPLKTHFEIGTAGSVSLVLHTIALPLALAEGESEVSIGGGTHVEWSPPFEFLSPHWTGWMARCGLELKVKLARAGYYPRGGGLVRVKVKGGGAAKPLALAPLPPGARNDFEFRGRIVITRLDESIARRIERTASHEMERAGFYMPVETAKLDGPGPGVAFAVTASWKGDTLACFSSIGRKGKPAEKVAREAARGMLAFVESRAMLDPHIADQLVVPLSLAGDESRYTTSEVTQHLLTNLETAAEFTGMRWEVKGEVGKPGEVAMLPPK